MEKEIIVAVKRDNQNRIIEYKTNKNNIYNYEVAKEYVEKGFIDNAKIIKDKNSLSHIIEKNNPNSKFPFEKAEEF